MGKLLLASVTLLLSILVVPAAHAQQNTAPPLETIRNFQVVSGQLASAGQIGYEQIPLLRDEGYDVVVNLAVADEDRNAREGFLVTQSGLTYVHIPVEWEQPQLSDVEMFFDVMRANRGRKVFVHCFANMRASAFVYLYRTKSGTRASKGSGPTSSSASSRRTPKGRSAGCRAGAPLRKRGSPRYSNTPGSPSAKTRTVLLATVKQ